MVTSKKHSSAKAKPSSLSGKDKVCNGREYDEGLVGSRIRVWWPLDRKFYEGVVDSFNSSRKKHRVLYDDGDKEILDMKKERWELIEEDDDKGDEISLQDESAEESSDATPEPITRKKVKSNGKSSDKGRADEAMPKKKQKIDSSAKSKSKDEVKQTPKTGNVGGKIVAAASRMSGRFHSKQNGLEKETLKSKKPSKKIVKKPRTSSKNIKSIDDEDGDDEDGSTSDDESKPLLSFINKSPEAVVALMEKLKRKKEKEAGEGSPGNEVEEAGEESSGNEVEEAGEGSSGNEVEEAGEESSGNEAEEAGEESSGNEAEEAGEGSSGNEAEESGEESGEES